MIEHHRVTRRKFLHDLLILLTSLSLPGLLVASQRINPIQETQVSPEKTLPIDYMWLGSSTVWDIGYYLSNINNGSVEQSWNIDERSKRGKTFIRGKYGGKIDDVFSWLNDEQVSAYKPRHINILIGGNEIGEELQIPDEELPYIAIAKEYIEMAKIINAKFPNARLHFILPFSTLMGSTYEARRRLLNQAVVNEIDKALTQKQIFNTDYLDVNSIVTIPNSNNPSERIINPEAFRIEGKRRHLTDITLNNLLNFVYNKIGR